MRRARGQATAGERRAGCRPPGDLAQFVQGTVRFGGQVAEPRPQPSRFRRYFGLHGAQLQREGDQPLLGAVVQIALKSPPFGVAGGDDPLA